MATVITQMPVEINDIDDRPNDAGDGLILYLSVPEDPTAELMSCLILRREAGEPDGCFDVVFAEGLPLEEEYFVDGYDPDYPVHPGIQYEYKSITVTVNSDSLAGQIFLSPVVAKGELYNTVETPTLIAGLVFIGMIFFYFHRAQRGVQMYLRPIAGIEAIDEAIGRATEMGKPILYVPGLSSISDVATIASLTILCRVARKIAEYQTEIIVPNCDPIVYTVACESVKQAYAEAGRPDEYDPDSVFFLTTSQFAYVAGVNGIMMRDKPATNFYLGMFWAESLLLAETGSLSGAIQIAGTDAVTQLPFFITTCDYTLIGEELYAASAYLGREPREFGAVKGQDACKAIIMILIVTGFLLGALYAITGNENLMFLRDIMVNEGEF